MLTWGQFVCFTLSLKAIRRFIDYIFDILRDYKFCDCENLQILLFEVGGY